MHEIEQWLAEVSGGRTLRQIATDAGISIPTLSRQVRESTLTPENAVRVARQYRRSPLGGLVAIGLLSEAEAASADPETALRTVAWDELLREIKRRHEDATQRQLTEAPLDNL